MEYIGIGFGAVYLSRAILEFAFYDLASENKRLKESAEVFFNRDLSKDIAELAGIYNLDDLVIKYK